MVNTQERGKKSGSKRQGVAGGVTGIEKVDGDGELYREQRRCGEWH